MSTESEADRNDRPDHTNASGAKPEPPTEVELKYRAADRTVAERLLASPTLGTFAARGDVTATRHDDHYFDTVSGALRNAGYAARLRETPDGTLLTLKSRSSSTSGLHSREELEAPASPDLEPQRWPPSDARSLLLQLSGDDGLVETVRIDQTRHRRTFASNGTSVELSLDDVRVIDGGTEIDRFVELEAELTSGGRHELEQLEHVLTEIPGLDPSPESKLEIAERSLRRHEHRVASRAPRVRTSDERGVPRIDGEDPLTLAATKVIGLQFERMVTRAAAVESDRGVRDLHALRVATRRQRAALRLFEDALPRRKARRLRRALRGVGRSVGAVRDLDVLIDGAAEYAAALPATRRDAMQPLIDDWRRRREEELARAVKWLGSRRYQRLVIRERAFLARARDARRTTPLETPQLVRDTAPARIWAAYHAVRAYERILGGADVTTLHALRIEVKRLRYTIEFFADALGPEAADLVSRLVSLQDHLGRLHDADVGARLARDYLRAHAWDLHPPQLLEIGRYAGDREADLTQLRRSLDAPWRAVSGLRFRATLGRALARL